MYNACENAQLAVACNYRQVKIKKIVSFHQFGFKNIKETQLSHRGRDAPRRSKFCCASLEITPLRKQVRAINVSINDSVTSQARQQNYG